ncbi:MAG: hypothetical protein ACRD01_12985, partial [Terriglobales bacterium]
MRHTALVFLLASGMVLATVGLASVANGQAPAPAGASQRALTIPDLVAWKGVAGTAVSRDGRWFAYRATSMEGNGQVT